MPTICGLRRRGVSPAALASFCTAIGVTKVDTHNEWALLEHHIRQDLNLTSPRAMGVLDPVEVVIENWEAGRVWSAEVPVNPEDPHAGNQQLPFTGRIWIERDDVMENPPPKYFRLAPGQEVRLRGVGFLACTGIEKGADGRISRVRARLDHETLGGAAPADGRKVKATIHWISAEHACDAEVRLYDHLFTQPDPAEVPEGKDWKDLLAANSQTVLRGCKIPAAVAALPVHAHVQFERLGYFAIDPDSRPGAPVLNRTATLRDAWAKAQTKG
jgi:glutaminyl-tRNA synthetase